MGVGSVMMMWDWETKLKLINLGPKVGIMMGKIGLDQ